MKVSRKTPPVNGLAYHLPDGPAQIMDAPGTIRVSFVLPDDHVTNCIVQLRTPFAPLAESDLMAGLHQFGLSAETPNCVATELRYLSEARLLGLTVCYRQALEVADVRTKHLVQTTAWLTFGIDGIKSLAEMMSPSRTSGDGR